LTPNPILKALSTLRTFRVRFLLMGGQACVLYGAAEFSRDADIAILAEPDNLRRLVEVHQMENSRDPNADQIAFWFREARSPALLTDLARQYPKALELELKKRPVLALARDGRAEDLDAALQEEERRERAADREYWLPLKKELEQLAHGPRKRKE
jgi:hypothetical protein